MLSYSHVIDVGTDKLHWFTDSDQLRTCRWQDSNINNTLIQNLIEKAICMDNTIVLKIDSW